MSEMVEAVRKAIWDAEWGERPPAPGSFHHIASEKMALAAVNAVLDALEAEGVVSGVAVSPYRKL